MNDFPHRPLSPAGTMRRRELLARAAQMGIALPALGALGAACGSSSSSPPSSSSGPPTGTAVLLNYQGWMGKHVADREGPPGAASSRRRWLIDGAVPFQALSTDAALRQAVTGQASPPTSSSWTGRRSQHQERRRVPAVPHAASRLRQDRHRLSHRHGLGALTSWADLGTWLPNSGQDRVSDLDRDCTSHPQAKGLLVNTTDQNELDQALQALIDIKPHLQALKSYNIGQGLAQGSYAIAMDWDYDVALAQQDNPHIKWVLPSEGASAYLEGFFAVKNTPQIEVLEAFFNFFLEPKQYADFVNTTGTAYVSNAATPYINKTIRGTRR
jgi:hypothetical protein